MENFYTSYSKIIQNKTYYFVKKYLRFPEFNNVPDVVVGYGMHTDFDKACTIATVHDSQTRKLLMANIGNEQGQAKVIEMTARHADRKSMLR